MLVIAPEVADMPSLDAAEHLEALRQKLPPQYLTDVYFRVVRTREQVRDAFTGMHPKVVYYFGHAELRGEQICMLLGDADSGTVAVNAVDFKRLMGGHYPQLAYINACKSGTSGWHSVGYQLSPDVPVVIAPEDAPQKVPQKLPGTPEPGAAAAGPGRIETGRRSVEQFASRRGYATLRCMGERIAHTRSWMDVRGCHGSRQG